MTADTETIREALKQAGWTPRPFEQEPYALALAALGRVEERERALTETLEEIAANPDARVRSIEGNEIEPWRSRGRLMGSPRLIALAALSSAAGSGEQEQDGRASAASTSRERQTEGRAEE